MAEVQFTIEYREIPGFSGYRVGNDGSVWSCRPRNGIGKFTEFRRLVPGFSRGYQLFGLQTADGAHKTIMGHRLVLLAFVGPPPDGMEACHNDGNRWNNHLTNLRWDTRKSNHADQFKHGTRLLGSRHPRAVLNDEQRQEIRLAVKSGRKGIVQELAAKYRVHRSTILRVSGGLYYPGYGKPAA